MGNTGKDIFLTFDIDDDRNLGGRATLQKIYFFSTSCERILVACVRLLREIKNASLHLM